MIGARSKLSLENYLSFFEDRSDLTNLQLNQIILMHGFSKLHKHNKKQITDVLNSLDLMRPTRSTLLDSMICSSAVLTLDEVKEDIESIGWRECPVGSIMTARSTAPEEAASIASSAITTVSVKKRAKKKKRGEKRKRISSVSTMS